MSTSAGKPEILKLAEILDITKAAPLAGDLLKARGSEMRIDAAARRFS